MVDIITREMLVSRKLAAQRERRVKLDNQDFQGPLALKVKKENLGILLPKEKREIEEKLG